MIQGILLLALLILLFGPTLWVKSVLARHSKERDDLPGTGGELALHLVERFKLDVQVERIDGGDHYDSQAKTIRLNAKHYDRRSLAGAVVAAHEFGHALQDAQGYTPLTMRVRMARLALLAQKIGAGLMMVLPVMTAITRAPSSGLLLFIAGVLSFGVAIVVHFITLPVEWDASFKRALPILAEGYLDERDMKHAHDILTAAALSYVAAALMSLVNIRNWWQLLRR